MAEQGKDATIFGTDGLFAPTEFNIEGAYVSSFAPDITDIPESEELAAEYRETYGEEIGNFGPPSFVAANVAMEAIKRVCDAGGDPDRASVLAEVHETDMATSILGQPIGFDEGGDLVDAEFFVFQIISGEYQLLSEPQ
jgi:ABC-type branched-subunit amino acid transport system substrate-binding protein